MSRLEQDPQRKWGRTQGEAHAFRAEKVVQKRQHASNYVYFSKMRYMLIYFSLESVAISEYFAFLLIRSSVSVLSVFLLFPEGRACHSLSSACASSTKARLPAVFPFLFAFCSLGAQVFKYEITHCIPSLTLRNLSVSQGIDLNPSKAGFSASALLASLAR